MSKINPGESEKVKTVGCSITFMFLVMGHSSKKYKIDSYICHMTLWRVLKSGQ